MRLVSGAMAESQPTYLEFFAGGGLAGLGLGAQWRRVFANDRDGAKGRAFQQNFPGEPFRLGDVWDLDVWDLPQGRADLAWASFPCQDLSVAGGRGGLDAPRSAAFWGFWRLMEGLAGQGRPPKLIVLENVVGLLSSRAGADFSAIGAVFAKAGYRFGALEIDAADFVPHSRPRVFVVAAARDVTIPRGLTAAAACSPGHTAAVRKAAATLGPALAHWLWWRLPAPAARNSTLADVLDHDACDVCWNTPEKTNKLLAQMDARHRARLADVQAAGTPGVGALYRRIRETPDGRVQRAEVRFDGLAGCLRTAAGGSSRQTLVFVDGDTIRTRLISPREAARLMGLPEEYVLPARATAALHLLGDAVAVPAVRWVADRILEPVLAGARARKVA